HGERATRLGLGTRHVSSHSIPLHPTGWISCDELPVADGNTPEGWSDLQSGHVQLCSPTMTSSTSSSGMCSRSPWPDLSDLLPGGHTISRGRPPAGHACPG